ncbi:hypothetical protein [uncultured Subdoligranulum sp.]|uniref:hypothetical protein n=1 Tax=uncultured Subdoligranulum sp. TaxID=512298 RepID=UPI003207A6A2
MLNATYVETSAAVTGIYVQALDNFTAELVYTAEDGVTLTKTLDVVVTKRRAMTWPSAPMRNARCRTY